VTGAADYPPLWPSSGHSEPAAETMGTGVERVGPIAHATNDADALLPNLHNLGDHEVDGAIHSPVFQS
jgi:hypothetical protein